MTGVRPARKSDRSHDNGTEGPQARLSHADSRPSQPLRPPSRRQQKPPYSQIGSASKCSSSSRPPLSHQDHCERCRKCAYRTRNSKKVERKPPDGDPSKVPKKDRSRSDCRGNRGRHHRYSPVYRGLPNPRVGRPLHKAWVDSDDGRHCRHRKLKPHVEERLRTQDQKNDRRHPQRIQSVRRSLKERPSNEETRHNDCAHHGGASPRDQHVEPEDPNREGGPCDLHGTPAQPKSHQQRTEEHVQHHAHQEHVEARHREEMHEPGHCKSLLLAIPDPTSVSKQKGPKHRSTVGRRHVPRNLGTNVPTHTHDERLSHPPVPAPNRHRLPVTNVHRTADASPSQIGGIVEAARIPLLGRRVNDPLESQSVALIHGRKSGRFLPGRGPKRHSDSAPETPPGRLPPHRVHRQRELESGVRSLGRIRDGPNNRERPVGRPFSHLRQWTGGDVLLRSEGCPTRRDGENRHRQEPTEGRQRHQPPAPPPPRRHKADTPQSNPRSPKSNRVRVRSPFH